MIPNYTLKPHPTGLRSVEKTLHCARSKTIADLLQCDRIFTRTEAVIQCFIANSSFLQRPLGPLLTVEPKPNRKRRIGISLPESPSPFRVPEVEVEVVDVGHLAPPVHVRVRFLLMPLPGLRTPRRCFFLSDSDEYDALLACTGSRFDVGASYLFLVVFLLLFLALLLTLLVEV